MHSRIEAILSRKGRVVHTIDAGHTVASAVSLMNQHNVGALVVVEGDKPIGMFSERDVLVGVVAAGRRPDTTLVSAVMTPRVISIALSTSIPEALAIVTDQHCRHLPVVEEGNLVGMISSGDLTRWIMRDQRWQIEDMTGFVSHAVDTPRSKDDRS